MSENNKMIKKIRDNLFLADFGVTLAKMRENNITVVGFVCLPPAKLLRELDRAGIIYYVVKLHRPDSGKVNRPYVRDIACHIPKYMISSGETVCVVGETGLVRGAYTVARAVCEMETSSIYDVFLEIKEILGNNFDIGGAYL